MNERIILLNLIKKHKDTIFSRGGKRSSSENKIEAWLEIEKKAKELRLVESNKDWRHIRNITWQNWRKRAIDKAVLAKKHYGTDKAKKYIFDQGEKIIFEILGNDSPVSVDTYYASSGSSCEEDTVTTQLPAKTISGSEMLHNKDNTPESVPLDKDNSAAKKRKLSMKPANILTMKTDVKPAKHLIMEKDVKPADILTMKRDLIRKEKELITKQMEMIKCQFSRLKGNTNDNSKGDQVSEKETESPSLTREKAKILPNKKNPSELSAAENVTSKTQKASDSELTALRKSQILLEQKLISNQLEMFERERYKMDLEIYKMEMELNVPPSKFTRKFYENEDTANNGIVSLEFDFFNEANNHIEMDNVLHCKLEPGGQWQASASDAE